MATMWGIHNNTSLDLVGGGFVSVGWDDLGPLEPPLDREDLKSQLAATYPTKKPGAIPGDAGVLIRFAEEMQPGDYVISPQKSDRTINCGIVDGDFYTEPEAETHRNRRRVRWVRVGIPRDDFPQPALNEIGSAITLFKVTRHVGTFLPMFDDGAVAPATSSSSPGSDEAELDLAEDEPNAERVDTYSRDFIVNVLKRMDPHDFERFVAGLLNAMGYRATATQASGDGGVDVIASRDALAIEPPIIKVQCKRMTSTVGAPDVQRLAGTLGYGGGELGLFVTLGAYSADAKHLERTHQHLRLVNGTELVQFILDHYERLDSEWKRLVPLKLVYAVDRGGDSS
jgi:restriction system protein